jgi:hypothetical protein
MRVQHVLLAASLAAITAGCFRHPETTPKGARDHISRAELERSREMTLYDAVAKLRPMFLRNRSFVANGRSAAAPIMVYLDGEKLGSGVDDLRRIAPAEVEEVRFYEPAQANVLFSRYNNYGGAIAIKLRPIGD